MSVLTLHTVLALLGYQVQPPHRELQVEGSKVWMT